MPSNAEIYCRAIDLLWNEGRLDLAGEFFSSDYRGYDPAFPRTGVVGAVEAIRFFQTVFAEMRYTVLHTLEQGDWVAARWEVSASFHGPLMGLRGKGQRVVVPGLSMNRFVGGKIVEGYITADYLSLFKQLGQANLTGVKL